MTGLGISLTVKDGHRVDGLPGDKLSNILNTACHFFFHLASSLIFISK